MYTDVLPVDAPASDLGLTRTQALNIFEQRRLQADHDLRQAAADAADPATQRDVEDLLDALGRYEALAAQTVVLNDQTPRAAGHPAPAALDTYRQATDLLRTRLLPAAATLTDRHAQALEARYESERGRILVVRFVVLGLGASALAALVLMQVWLVRRFRRLLNPALAAATCAALGGLILAVGLLGVEATHLRVAFCTSYAPGESNDAFTQYDQALAGLIGINTGAFTQAVADGQHDLRAWQWGLWPVWAAILVVFGDIGTSPIYTLQTVFSPDDPHPVPVSADNVYGVVSLVFWSVMIIVTVTYVLLAMRADNDGEGGIMALITLLRRDGGQRGRRATMILAGLGIFGAALFFGDSMITPAISVLSAVEGLKVVQPSLDALVVPITAVIIIALFLVQRRGTAAVGRVFGPVMIAWFVAIGVCGVAGIAAHPAILGALSPTYAISFLAGHFGVAFFALAAIVLAVTGAEALYADMGHFGRRSITRGWLILVFPACVLSYLGQGALILDDPANISSPFFLLAPGWARLALVLLATAATVIASQAVITGAYSVAAQAAELGYLPRLRVEYTSESRMGQIYVPWINWLLLVSVLTLVFAFRSSAALAFAFGMAVTGTITITTLLFFVVARRRWRTPLWLLGIGAAALLLVDLLFVAANLTKLVHGAWLPLLIGLTAFTIMTTWQRGRQIVTAERQRREGSLRDFIAQLRDHPSETIPVPGTAVFLNRGKQTAPLAMRANVEHNHVRHQQVLIIAIQTEPVPRVPAAERIAVDDLGYGDDGIVHVTVRFGYADTPALLPALRMLEETATEGRLDLDGASYFLSKIELRRGDQPTMAAWRKRLFIATSYLTADAAEHFGLPRDRTVIMGSHIEV